MKKHLLFSAVVGITLIACNSTFAQSSKAPNVSPNGTIRCATDEHLAWLKQHDAALEGRMQKIEDDMQAWISSNAKNPKPMAIITIPTVVHVVYNSAAENLADTYIQQQIAVLNADYTKTNTDWNKTPATFLSLVADCQVKFCLASKDPAGAATTGIIHKQSTVTSWSQNDAVKSTAQGGDDAWDATKYLNLWVCNLGGGLLGYAQFPGGSNSTDGVVVLYNSLPGPPVMSAYDMGRTATHEVGHWLNLRHINGDANCGNDQVTDTPTQDQLHFGVPVHPLHSNVCSGTANGEMFMNYMDYVDDISMYMFSVGQSTRISACLASTRSGLGPASLTKCSGNGIDDLLPQDNISLYPNPSTGDIFMTINVPNISSAEVVVFNAIGEAVLEKKVVVPSNNEIKLDMNSKPDGMYLVKLKTSEGTITKKIVINR
jgi:hypothetical protein